MKYIEIRFIDRENNMFQWTQWYSPFPSKVLFRNRLWQYMRVKGSTYYTPAKGQLWLPGVDLEPDADFDPIARLE